MERINEDLVFNFVEDNSIDEETQKPRIVEISFTFFGKVYMAYLKVASLLDERLSYPMVEGPGKLLEAFEEELESLEVEKFVREKVKEHLLAYHSDDK